MFQSILFLWQAPAPPQGGMGGLGTLLFFGIAIAIIYFMMIRPQSKVRKQQSDFWSSLKKGKKVVTIGGVHGTIASMEDKTVSLLISQGVYITVQRDCISMDMTNANYADEHKNKEANVATGQN